MTVISAQVIADSVSIVNGTRLTTVQYSAPRCILAEINTHRAFSRNARSSRAVPFAKMLDEIMDSPFIPHEWGMNEPGMQARSHASEEIANTASEMWREALDDTYFHAEQLAKLGLHKQIVNRLLEPFMFVHGLISSTDWKNFFALRCHPDAEPHMRLLAESIREAINKSVPIPREIDDWHMPYVTTYERENFSRGDCKLASAARCARISYTPFSGENASFTADVARGLRMSEASPLHASPFEHVAVTAVPTINEKISRRLCGNFRGWYQYRNFLPGNVARED